MGCVHFSWRTSNTYINSTHFQCHLWEHRTLGTYFLFPAFLSECESGPGQGHWSQVWLSWTLACRRRWTRDWRGWTGIKWRSWDKESNKLRMYLKTEQARRVLAGNGSETQTKAGLEMGGRWLKAGHDAVPWLETSYGFVEAETPRKACTSPGKLFALCFPWTLKSIWAPRSSECSHRSQKSSEA